MACMHTLPQVHAYVYNAYIVVGPCSRTCTHSHTYTYYVR